MQPDDIRNGGAPSASAYARGGLNGRPTPPAPQLLEQILLTLCAIESSAGTDEQTYRSRVVDVIGMS